MKTTTLRRTNAEHRAFVSILTMLESSSSFTDTKFRGICRRLESSSAFREFSDRFDVDSISAAMLLIAAEHCYSEEERSGVTTARRTRRNHGA